MSDTYERGDVVNITIRGARITEVGDIALGVALSGGRFSRVPLDCEDVTVERVAPAEWPPLPGDKWRDRNGSAWFAFYGLEAREVFMIPADPIEGPLTTPTPATVLAKVGPLTLVHREDEQDGKSKTPTAGTEVPNRPGRVVGDCGHPVWRAVWDGGERTCQPCQDAFAAEMSGGDQPLLLDPDCRDGKHGSCVGGLCECVCHEQDGGRSDG